MIEKHFYEILLNVRIEIDNSGVQLIIRNVTESTEEPIESKIKNLT